jgi:pre-mRNA-splicing helicase BRR2
MDEDIGVSVIVDDDIDDMKEDGYEVSEGDSDDDEMGVEAYGSGMLKGDDSERDMKAEEDSKHYISIHDIDAHWLQRQLSKYYSDANMSSKLAEEILTILRINDERNKDNALVHPNKIGMYSILSTLLTLLTLLLLLLLLF